MGDARQPSIGFGVILTTATSFVTTGLGIVINFLVIRLLPPGDLGLFLGVQSLVFAGCGLCDLGLSQAYRQMASREPFLRQALLGPTLVIQVCAIAAYFTGLAVYMAREDLLTVGTALVAVGALAAQLPEVLDHDLNIARRYRRAVLLNVLSVSGLALGAVLAWAGPDRFGGLALGYSVGLLARFACAAAMSGASGMSFRFTRATLAQARAGIPFLASLLITRMGQFFGVSYLLATQGAHAAGILGFPMKVYQTMLVLSSSTTSATLPHFHRLAQAEALEGLGAAMGKLVGPLWVAAGCMAGVCVLCPESIVDLVGGGRYADSAGLLRVLGLAFLLKALAIPAGNLLESRGLQWVRVAVQATSTAIIVLCVLGLYGRLGISVAVYSMLAADACSFTLLWGANAVGMAHDLPWRKHAVAAVLFAASLGLAWMAPGRPAVEAVFFVGFYATLTALLGVWEPRKLLTRLVRR